MNFPGCATHGPSLGEPATAARRVASSDSREPSCCGLRVVPSRSGMTEDRSRATPWGSSRPGLSAPLGPEGSSFPGYCLYWALVRRAAVRISPVDSLRPRDSLRIALGGIAASALYLASDEAIFTMGQCHGIDRGWSN